MDDNSRHPKPKIEAGEQLRTLIRVVKDTSQTFRPKEITNILVGRVSSAIKGLKVDKKPFFGIGKDREDRFWMALLRQGLVGGYLRKEIEQYGVLKVTPKGEAFLCSSEGFLMTEDHNYDALEQEYATARAALRTRSCSRPCGICAAARPNGWGSHPLPCSRTLRSKTWPCATPLPSRR